MKKVKLLCLLIICIGCGTIAHAQKATPVPSSELMWSEAEEKINTLVTNAKSVRNYQWGNRGPAPLGYLKGMAMSYAMSHYAILTNQDTAIREMTKVLGDAKSDALALYGLKPATNKDRLRAAYTLAIGLGMRESTGNTTEGWDKGKTKYGIVNTEANAEAGLFQFSWDSRNKSPWLLKLYEQYQLLGSERCMQDIFLEGVKNKNVKEEGTGDGAKFQKFTKECPAFAAEYVIIMLRANRSHFGPINNFHKKPSESAEYRQEVETLLKQVEKIADLVRQFSP